MVTRLSLNNNRPERSARPVLHGDLDESNFRSQTPDQEYGLRAQDCSEQMTHLFARTGLDASTMATATRLSGRTDGYVRVDLMGRHQGLATDV
jgi:hypothetical protein